MSNPLAPPPFQPDEQLIVDTSREDRVRRWLLVIYFVVGLSGLLAAVVITIVKAT